MATGFLKSPAVTLNTNTRTINVTGFIDCSKVVSGTAVILGGGSTFLEGIGGTNYDVSGNSTITLRDNYTGTTLNNVEMTAFNTTEGLRDAIRQARDISNSSITLQNVYGDVLTSEQETILVDINGVSTPITPYGYLKLQAEDLLINAGTAIERDAATTAEAIAGTSNKLPDTIGVKAAVTQIGKDLFVENNPKLTQNLSPLPTNASFSFGFGGAATNATEGDNPFPLFNGAFSLVNAGSAFSNNAYVSQIATKYVESKSSQEIKIRGIGNENPEDDCWVTLLHDYNTGSAVHRDAATTAEAIAGTSNKLPDAAGVHASFNQYGIGSTTRDIDVINDTTAKSGLYRTPPSGSPTGGEFWHTVFMNRVGSAQSAVIQMKDTSSMVPEMYIRHRGGDGVWGDPAEVYHSGNKATTAEAIAGTSNKLPDTIGVKAAVTQIGKDLFVENNPKLTQNLSPLPTNASFSYGYGGANPNPTEGDNPFPLFGGAFSLINTGAAFGGNAYVSQIAIRHRNSKADQEIKIRGIDNENPEDDCWVELRHDYNLIHVQNLSGATVASNATTSGANLNPAKSGTWRNISGNNIFNTGYGLWERV